jgi:hypothetical protein
MKNLGFYKSIVLVLAFGLSAFLCVKAQTNPAMLGSQQNPIYDSLLVVTDGVYLRFRYGATESDSLIWRNDTDNILTYNQDSLLATQSISGTLRVKRSSKWYFAYLPFVGISYDGNYLEAPIVTGALYIWSLNSNVINNSSPQLFNHGPGEYMVTIIFNGGDQVSYNFDFTKWAPSNVVQDNSILDSTGNLFSIKQSISPEQEVWRSPWGMFSYGDGSFEAQFDGRISVYVLQANHWLSTSFVFHGIKEKLGTLSVDYFDNAVYKWYKDGVLVKDSTNKTLGNLSTGTYQVEVYKDSASGYASKTFNTYGYIYVKPGGFLNPTKVSNLISQNGIELTISNQYLPDSISWNIEYVDNGTGTATSSKSILLNNDMKVFLKVYQAGTWYEQDFSYFGIKYDSTYHSLNAPIVPNATYSWYDNGLLIQGANGPSYLPTDTGKYTVKVSWADTSSAFALNFRLDGPVLRVASYSYQVSNSLISTDLADNSVKESYFNMYPNPATGRFYLSSPVSTPFHYSLQDMTSKEVMRGMGIGIEEINVVDLPAGIYYVHLKTAEQELVKRLLIK